MSKLFQCLCHYIGLYFLQGPSANYKAGIARKQQLLTFFHFLNILFKRRRKLPSIIIVLIFVMQNVSFQTQTKIP